MVVWDINTVKKVIEEYRERRGLSTEEDISQIDDETCTSDDQLTEIGEAFQEEGDRDLEEFAKPVPYSGKKKRRVASRDTDAKRADEAYEIMKAASNRDDCAIYGEYVASELRKLSGYSQMMPCSKPNSTFSQPCSKPNSTFSQPCSKPAFSSKPKSVPSSPFNSKPNSPSYS
ncbi:hypothetical protein O3P69_011937 [Scylla paramamosain]|uniref:Uncharacterized protein n=1 Tax=Scylla paramamosain TaxID=85552 RepID=A0AAW0SA60_SCYPA